MPVPKAKTAAAEKGVAAKAEAPVPENPAKPKWMQYRKAKPEAAQTTDEEAEEWSDDNGSDGSCLESEGTTSSSESDSDSGESEGSSSGTSDSERLNKRLHSGLNAEQSSETANNCKVHIVLQQKESERNNCCKSKDMLTYTILNYGLQVSLYAFLITIVCFLTNLTIISSSMPL
ncbi:uncharacterized protein LOC124165752 isoform X2 [Ischnura elegans]|uniref:uncharacterized protein LOC124165752 isoform X2 n=1 Tax=Ischnura elegans TaxID=197161 RepID=UPI001ED8AA65|nr:uncharacterized protein LOC124165752 isoform X2 [Ischnura elegans]